MSISIAHDIEMLAELFKTGQWDELRVGFDGVSILLSNNPSAAPIGGTPVSPVPPSAPAMSAPSPTAPAKPSPVPTAPLENALDPSWTPVVAPNLGTFYRSPKPGSAPFVEVGQRVEGDTEICLLEVMKLFTSVKAGLAGIVRRISATDGELVEGGQLLFHIEPA